MESSRKREALSDASNTMRSTPKRSCAARAVKEIAKLNIKKAPGPQSCATTNPQTGRPEVLKQGQDIIHKFIERNATFAQQKATALNIFSISVLEGDAILKACDTASKFTGYNAEDGLQQCLLISLQQLPVLMVLPWKQS